MKVTVLKDAQAIAAYAVDQIEALIKRKPNCVLGLPTGSSPLPTYQEMVRRYQAGKIDFSEAIPKFV